MDSLDGAGLGVLSAAVLATLTDQFGEVRAVNVVAIEWDGWNRMVNEVLELDVADEDVLLQLAWDAVMRATRGFVRIAAENETMPQMEDEARIAQLREQGWEKRFGRVFEANNCLADSLLQLLVHHGVLSPEISEPERQKACTANREGLLASDSALGLRPRKRDPFTAADLGEDDGAYLQHDVHAVPTVRFFLEWFAARGQVLRELPAAGIHLIVMSRFDSPIAPMDELFICAGLGSGDATGPLTFALYNVTGEGISGSHYDPMVRMAGAVLDMGDVSSAEASEGGGDPGSGPAGDVDRAQGGGVEQGGSSGGGADGGSADGALGDGGQARSRGPASERWRRFTPRVIAAGLCQARTWSGGLGGQCKWKPVRTDEANRKGLCKMHANEVGRQGRLTHGRVDGDIPDEKYSAFEDAAVKREGHSVGAPVEAVRSEGDDESRHDVAGRSRGAGSVAGDGGGASASGAGAHAASRVESAQEDGSVGERAPRCLLRRRRA